MMNEKLTSDGLADEVVGNFDCPICGIAWSHMHSAADIVRHRNAQKLARVHVEDWEAFKAWTERGDLGGQPTMLFDAWIAARDFYRGKAP